MAGLVAVGTTLLNSALRCSLLVYSPQWWVATACVTSSISQGNFGAWMAGAMFRVSDEGERSVEGDRERWGRLRLWGGIGYVRSPQPTLSIGWVQPYSLATPHGQATHRPNIAARTSCAGVNLQSD